MYSFFTRHFRHAYKLSTARYGLFHLSSTACFVRPPSKFAPREAPTPLLFVSSESWDKESAKEMKDISAVMSEKGFTCIETDLAVSYQHMRPTEMMKEFEAELSSTMRLSMIPFPPVIFARSAGGLIAQQYVSSHPASGLILISPPISNAALTGDLLPSDLAEFDFEPKFPIAIVATTEEMKSLQQRNRLCQDANVDRIVVESLDAHEILPKAEEWLDFKGI
ncbi:hypothetical protein BDQ17DRAFT_1340843 [Cyathus striatus]|nr:hypothetical protein BDQ17DRAFT_1340843 [Cyathus striatus]